jgi:uncharacterized DUF497 family protein
VLFQENIDFEWDEGNREKNWQKHQVTTEEAEEAFLDKKNVVLSDIRHSENEERYVLIGKTKQGRMLFTVFTFRGERIRIISARDANRKEAINYEKAAHRS